MKLDLNRAGQSGHADDFLLEEARMAADTDWAEGFVADLLELRRKYGLGFRLSDRQRTALEKICDGDGR